VESYYRNEDGTPTGEVQAMRYALRPLKHVHPNTLVARAVISWAGCRK
jgi:hypothetical protein